VGRNKEGRNPAKGKYCEKRHRWAVDIAGKMKCRSCYDARIERRRSNAEAAGLKAQKSSVQESHTTGESVAQ
jgi:predicted adenine nucleotide alpha hydrolase (AANH) superfamily ATPase